MRCLVQNLRSILNLIGGIIFVTGTNTGAEFYVENLSFQCKVVALLIAFVNLLIFRFSGLEHRVFGDIDPPEPGLRAVLIVKAAIRAGKRLPRYSQLYGGIDAFNALMTERSRNFTLEEVQTQFEAVHSELLAYLASLTD